MAYDLNDYYKPTVRGRAKGRYKITIYKTQRTMSALCVKFFFYNNEVNKLETLIAKDKKSFAVVGVYDKNAKGTLGSLSHIPNTREIIEELGLTPKTTKYTFIGTADPSQNALFFELENEEHHE